MRKTKYLTIIAILIAFTSLTTTAFSETDADPLLGNWISEDGYTILSFLSNNTLTAFGTENDIEIESEWSITSFESGIYTLQMYTPIFDVNEQLYIEIIEQEHMIIYQVYFDIETRSCRLSHSDFHRFVD